MEIDRQMSLVDVSPEYAAFVQKFQPKKTTDDCYTPPVVYDAIADWVAKEYGVERARFIRPFYPGGDYEREEYPEGCAVVDNPPFSLVAQIVRFYTRWGIRFFIFAPTLTLFTRLEDVTHIPAGIDITYENGAEVKTSFITNMDAPGLLVRSAPELYRVGTEANKRALKAKKSTELPKYTFPDNLLTAAMAYRYSQYGVEYRLHRESAVRVSTLDAMKGGGKSGIFGGGLLLSSRAAAERRKATKWRLSPREEKIIAELDERERLAGIGQDAEVSV